MKIGINATCLNDRPSGAKQRFIGIYGALFQSLPETEFYLFEPSDCRVTKWFNGLPNVIARPTPVSSMGGRLVKYMGGLTHWNKVFHRERFDLFESMHLPLVRPRNGASLLTIHDIRYLYHENILYRSLFAKLLRYSLQRVDHVVTVSGAMREEILDFFPHPSVSVVPNGFDAEIFDTVTLSDRLAFLAEYKLPEKFILSVGHFEERKNYTRLLEAVSLLHQRDFIYPLVIIGNDSGETAYLYRQIQALNLQGHVWLLTGLSDIQVRCSYLSSSLFVFPSLYEGFGIPILEAMACGCPMVLSDLPVFREITENQGIYFQPKNIDSMACAIETGLASSRQREQIVLYGLRRVKDFSFANLAENMADIYRRIYTNS